MGTSWRSLDSYPEDYLEFLGDCHSAADQALAELAQRSAVKKVWNRDGTLWTAQPSVAREIENRLGWLSLPQTMRAEVPGLENLARDLKSHGLKRAVLLGMGGSSLGPEVLREVFGVAPGSLDLVVLDATDPAQIMRVEQAEDLEKTVFLASSKSGTTAETRALLEYFQARLKERVGDRWPRHVIAISDPGTELLELARRDGFAAGLSAVPDVGGRYSVLTTFGLAPAALIGMDCDRLLARAQSMAERCGARVAEGINSACRLGAAMAALARAGRDKLTLITSPRLSSFGWWAEQLIAESTGKNGVGIVPVEGEPFLAPVSYGRDRLFVYVRLRSDDNAASDDQIRQLIALGQPAVIVQLDDLYDLGGEFFRWEFGTAIAGAVLGINPFDQPDVEAAKDAARDAIAAYERTGVVAHQEPVLATKELALYGRSVPSVPEGADMASLVRGFLSLAQPDDYVALMAYVDRTEGHAEALQQLRCLLSERLGLATTLGFGPRYLHSTGQLHKGGRNNGLFIQITQRDARDLPIPGRAYTFGVLKAAQAAGDMAALEQRGRRVIRLHMGPDVPAGLALIYELVDAALR